ncbi:UNVERIFIED_CONTAM: hypothetical protein Sindi_0049400, partial [Sesamum indicum]
VKELVAKYEEVRDMEKKNLLEMKDFPKKRNEQLDAQFKDLMASKEVGCESFHQAGVAEVFDQLVDMKVYDEILVAWAKCISQGFVECFDTSLISITKDENGKDYPDILAEVEVPMFDKFYSSLPRTFLDALYDEARERLTAKAAKEEGIKLLLLKVSVSLSPNPSHPNAATTKPASKDAMMLRSLLETFVLFGIERIVPLDVWMFWLVVGHFLE